MGQLSAVSVMFCSKYTKVSVALLLVTFSVSYLSCTCTVVVCLCCGQLSCTCTMLDSLTIFFMTLELFHHGSHLSTFLHKAWWWAAAVDSDTRENILNHMRSTGQVSLHFCVGFYCIDISCQIDIKLPRLLDDAEYSIQTVVAWVEEL